MTGEVPRASPKVSAGGGEAADLRVTGRGGERASLPSSIGAGRPLRQDGQPGFRVACRIRSHIGGYGYSVETDDLYPPSAKSFRRLLVAFGAAVGTQAAELVDGCYEYEGDCQDYDIVAELTQYCLQGLASEDYGQELRDYYTCLSMLDCVALDAGTCEP